MTVARSVLASRTSSFWSLRKNSLATAVSCRVLKASALTLIMPSAISCLNTLRHCCSPTSAPMPKVLKLCVVELRHFVGGFAAQNIDQDAPHQS